MPATLRNSEILWEVWKRGEGVEVTVGNAARKLQSPEAWHSDVLQV